MKIYEENGLNKDFDELCAPKNVPTQMRFGSAYFYAHTPIKSSSLVYRKAYKNCQLDSRLAFLAAAKDVNGSFFHPAHRRNFEVASMETVMRN